MYAGIENAASAGGSIVMGMRIGYQGEPHSYSHRAVDELFADGDAVGYPSFVAAFTALEDGAVDRLVLPVENSTTGSVLPVLDRLPGDARHQPFAIVTEHLVEVRHALLGLPGAGLADLREVRSHPEALAQAEGVLLELSVAAVPTHDTAGAVRQVADAGDPTVAALAPPAAGEAHGLVVLRRDVLDRDHNTTRFVVLAPGAPQVDPDDDKTTLVFRTAHTPGALALALTELGLRGANLTRIESRPATERWSYRFFVDLIHDPGPEGLAAVIDPPPATCAELKVLGSYRAAGA
jgi:prephenate dehydratase